MGKMKGWRKTFDSPDHISYQSTEDLLVNDSQAWSLFPKNSSIMLLKNYGTGQWNTMSDPSGYLIDEQVFSSKQKGINALISWMKDTQFAPPGSKKTVKSMTITLSANVYMDYAYLRNEDGGEHFINDIFFNGWKGVQQEFPTLDKFDWGYLTASMFFNPNEFIEVSQFLNEPIEFIGTFDENAIDLPDPDDPIAKRLGKKVKIIWK